MVLELTQAHLDRLKYLRTYPEWQLFQEVLEDDIKELIEFLINDGLTSNEKKVASHTAAQASISTIRRILALPEFYELSFNINPPTPDERDNLEG